MPELKFRIESAFPVPFSVSPQIAFGVRVSSAQPEEEVHSALLRCQIQIDAGARSYDVTEAEGLREVFGEGSAGARSPRRLLWTHATAVVPAFTHDVAFELHAPCTFDMVMSTTKYFRALLEGGAPVVVLFSGTVFHRDGDANLRASPVPWSAEARFVVPAQVWRDAMAQHYPSASPLAVRTDVFDRLDRYRRDMHLGTWDLVMERLLGAAAGSAGSEGIS